MPPALRPWNGAGETAPPDGAFRRPRRPLGGIAGLALLALCAGLCAAALADPAPASYVDYLYLEANEGASSGGHVALRVGATTYHYQYRAGLIELSRQGSELFDLLYRRLGNRTIHVERIEVDAESRALIEDGFRLRYLAERRQRAYLRSLEEDRRLLGALDGDPGRARLRVRAAGLFAPEEGLAGPEPALVRLRSAVEQRLGRGFLARRRRAWLDRLRDIRPLPPTLPPAELSGDEMPPAGRGLAHRLRQALAALVVLDVIERAAPLRDDALRQAPRDVARVSLRLRGRLERLAEALEERIVANLSSPGPYGALAALVGVARLVAVDRSLRSGRLVVVDALPERPESISLAGIRRRGGSLPSLLRSSRRELRRALRSLEAADGVAETALARVEAAVVRTKELGRALELGTAVRLVPEPLSGPMRRAAVALRAGPRLSRGEARTWQVRVGAAERAWREAIERRYGYDLVRRNCVTELLRLLAESLGGDPERESVRRLGGFVDPDAAWNFIPFVSARSVARRYRVVARWRLPSYRLERLASLGSSRGFAWRLLERSPLTSSLYRPHVPDSFFLFFTDDVLWARPPLGAANLAAAAGAALAGLALAPVDRGELLRSGLRGMLFSAPELAFANIRKGTFFAAEGGPSASEPAVAATVPLERPERGDAPRFRGTGARPSA